jgi:hypothetical protein
MMFVIALLKMGHIWYPKDAFGKPDTKDGTPTDMAIRLAKKLMTFL